MKIISVNKRSYPTQIISVNVTPFPGKTLEPFTVENSKIEVTTVLVAGAVDDYAAYVGIGSPEWIAEHGNKLSFDEAKIHFPSIVEERYRS